MSSRYNGKTEEEEDERTENRRTEEEKDGRTAGQKDYMDGWKDRIWY